MNGIQAIRNQLKLVSILILTLFLTNCSVVREPAVVGGTNIGMTCAGVVNAPAVIAACVAAGSVVGIDQVWNDDFNEHKKYFVDHLIGAPNETAITNWYNPKTRNSGIIRTSRTWYEGPIKCRQWESTINITPVWPVNFANGTPKRRTDFGIACIMPDGVVAIQQ